MRKEEFDNPILETIFDFIVDYKVMNDGNSPSIREIQNVCEISSTSMVSFYLRKLEKLGRIFFRNQFLSRSIQVVGGYLNIETTERI